MNHRFTELSKRIDDLRTDISKRMDDLRNDIRRLESNIRRLEEDSKSRFRWLMGTLTSIGLTGTLIATLITIVLTIML